MSKTRTASEKQEWKTMQKKLKGEFFASQDSLIASLEQGNSEEMKEYLAFASHFSRAKKYSWNNILLLKMQRPKARFFAKKSDWEELGYEVDKTKGNYISIPWYKTKKDEKTGEEKKIFTGRYFYQPAIYSEFDLTTPANELDIPDHWISRSLGNDLKDYYYRLKQLIESQKIVVDDSVEIPGGALARSMGGRIEIDRTKIKDYNNLFSTLIHEWAHEILHQGSENKALSTGIKEVQAESTAYMVTKAFGIESTISTDYLINWSDGSNKKAKQNFTSNLRQITSAGLLMIDAMQKDFFLSEDSNSADQEALDYKSKSNECNLKLAA